MATNADRYINPAVEARVLTGCARRCCLCFYLKRDFAEKEGQTRISTMIGPTARRHRNEPFSWPNISAKTGQGVPDVLEAIVKRISPPKGRPERHLQALLFDSWFDPYRGVVVLARVFEGTLRVGQKIRLWSNGRVFQVEALGVLTPKPVVIDELVAGEVGFIIANIKNVADTKIGDTITDDDRPAIEPLPGFEEIKPMVFAGLYTVDAHEHTALREALEKLKLNDSSFFFEPESSVALGFGFRCGFLGLLHMEII